VTPAAGAADAAGRVREALPQLHQAAADGGAAEPGDAGEEGDTAAAVLAGQQSHEETAAAFVQRGDHTIDSQMVPGQFAGWGSATVKATTAEGSLLLVGHGTSPLFLRRSGEGKIQKMTKLFLYSS
jgi:hypothetical protein